MDLRDAVALLAGAIVGAGALAALARPTEEALIRSGWRELVRRPWLKGMLRAAGIDLPPTLFLQFAVLWAATGGLIGLMAGLGPVAAGMLAFFGASFYFVRAQEQAATRRLLLAGELLVFLRMLAAGLRAGAPRSEAIARAKQVCGPVARRALTDLEERLARAGDAPEARTRAVQEWAAALAHPVATSAAQVLQVFMSGGAGVSEIVQVIAEEMDRVRRILEVARARGRGMQRRIYLIIVMSAAGLLLLIASDPMFRDLLLGDPISPVLIVGGWWGALMVSQWIMDRYFSMEETVGIARGGAGLIPTDRYGNPILPGGEAR
jgi:Flp pilus assembly protein TadB